MSFFSKFWAAANRLISRLAQRGRYGTPRGYLAICAIMKNEAIGILEWIAYHHALGVERFYLYDNGSTDETVSRVEPLVKAGIVELIEWPVHPGQMLAYEHFAAHHKRDWAWAAFIDLDEFINPFGFDSITDWLRRFDDRSGVAIQWQNFGPSAHDDPPAGLAIAAYSLRLPGDYSVHGHVKTIVRMAKYERVQNPHAFFVTDGEIVDERNEPVVRTDGEYAIQAPMAHADVCLNHYYTRSRSEWQIKLRRGRADADVAAEDARVAEWVDLYDREAIVPDDRILKFVPATEAMLKRFAQLASEYRP